MNTVIVLSVNLSIADDRNALLDKIFLCYSKTFKISKFMRKERPFTFSAPRPLQFAFHSFTS